MSDATEPLIRETIATIANCRRGLKPIATAQRVQKTPLFCGFLTMGPQTIATIAGIAASGSVWSNLTPTSGP